MEGIKVEAILSAKDVRRIAKLAVEMIDEKKKEPEKAIVKEAFTLDQIEASYNISTQTLARHIRNGLLKAKKPGKSYIVYRADLDNYLNSNNND